MLETLCGWDEVPNVRVKQVNCEFYKLLTIMLMLHYIQRYENTDVCNSF